MSRLIIRAGAAERHYWADLWRYRELFYFLSWRDILVRYKQTVIGVLWARHPAISDHAGFHGRVRQDGQDALRWPARIRCSSVWRMLPWQFFATAMSEASNSLVSTPT